jgi:acyl-CoA synthetase (AMP-forming)/AMP-acid ligase II
LAEPGLSIAHGIPLEEEPGIGALTVAGYLREIVARYGSREAVVMWDEGRRIAWSYDDLLARSMEVARALVACGVGAQGRVGVLMTNRPEFLAALFGTALIGGVPVALSTFSTKPELDYMLKASRIGTLLFEPQVLKKDFRAMIAGLEPAIDTAAPGHLRSERYPFLQRLVAVESDPSGVVETWDRFLDHGESVSEAVVLERADSIHPSDPGGIFFSSGTTSLPKGIAHSQRAFAIQWWRWPRIFAMREPVRAWTGNGFFWSGNVSMVAGSAFSTGGTLVLQRWFEEEEALELMEKERLAFVNGRPHQWARLQAAVNWDKVDLSSLKYIPRGEIMWAHPTVNTDWDVPMSFGTTETMTICTSRCADEPDDIYLGSMGRPLPGNTIKIVDPLTGKPVPLGTRGEMCIKGPTLMSGYLGKSPEECFDTEGFYCTGDGGTIDETGLFFWEGRLTDMIKTGGANVSPLEVDDVIARFPGVKRTQTVGVPDDLLGEMVVACVVPIDGAILSGDEIVAFVKTEVASFKAPRRVLFFTDAEYAITGSEKVKSSVVKELAVQRLQAEK